MVFPWVIIMLIGGIMLWWSLGRLGIITTDETE